MSTLRVANVQFDAAGTNRIDYLNDDVLRISTSGKLSVLSGNVGIGIASPTSNLHVMGSLFIAQNSAVELAVIGEIAEFAHNANSYAQIHVRNAGAGSLSSGDIVVTSDVGSDVSEYIDLGINNSTYNDPSWTINGAKDGYLYTSNGSMAIGVANTGKNLVFFTGGLTSNKERVRIDTNGNVSVGLTSTTYKLEVGGSFAAQTKSFVIDHPTKDSMKLQYACLEGPENAVYVRGKLDGTSIINLPEYWWNLVDQASITVNLTPYGRPQELWVQSVSTYAINLNQPAECFYTVFAERKDVPKLIVEY